MRWLVAVFPACAILDGLEKTLSIVNLNISSIILGNNVSSSFELSSIHGLVLVSISQQLRSESNMKSRPNSSKQFFRFYGFIFLTTCKDFNYNNNKNLLIKVRRSLSTSSLEVFPYQNQHIDLAQSS